MLPFAVLAFSLPQRLSRAVRWFGVPGLGRAPCLARRHSLAPSTWQLTVEIQAAVLRGGGLKIYLYVSLSKCIVG